VVWTELSDDGGPVLRYVEGVRDLLPIADRATVAPGRTVIEAVASAMSQLPGWKLATEDPELAEAMIAAGAVQTRHAYVMSADPSMHRDAPVVEIVPRSSIDVREFLPGWLASLPPGHPDHEDGTHEEIIERCWDWYDEPQWLAREHRSSGLVVSDGRVVAGIIISLRPQPVPYGGPWVHDVWRVPGESVPGTGAALIAQAMRLLDEDGLTTLGLAVSAGNPARRVYDRLGFIQQLEAWTFRIPPKS
jgi:hypothetical protein